MSKLSEAIKIFLIQLFRQMLFLNSIMLPLLLHFNLTESDFFFLNGIFLSTLVLSELPTGIFSDRHGAKKSIILSGILAVLGSCMILIDQTIINFIFFNIFFGLSLAFLSGSDLTILINTNNGAILGKKIFFKRAGNVLAAIITGTILIYSTNYIYLIYLQLITSIIALGISLSINYSNGIKKGENQKLKSLKELTKELYNNNSLFYLFFILLISSSSFFLLIGSFQPLLKLYSFDVSLFAYIYGAFQLAQGFICLYGEKLKKLGYKFAALGPLLALGIIYFTESSIILILCFFLILFCRGLFFYFMEYFLRETNKEHIATNTSLFNTIANIAVSTQSFIMGMLLNYISLKDSLLFLGTLILIAYILLKKIIKEN